MWSPTHIHVIVQRARGLLTKGKHETNNCFVSISLGKEKYLTSMKEKAPPNVEWHEECELTIPEKGNRAELVLTCLHRNNLQLEEFLGQITLPLNEMDAYERTKSKFYKLQGKPGKEKKDKDRGELEVRISFLVKSGALGSLSDLSKKEKKGSTLGIGGSLLSLGTLEKRKGLKKFAKSLGSKMHLSSKKKEKDGEVESSSNSNSISSIGTPGGGAFTPRRFGQTAADADPGVISEDDDEFVFDKLSHKSSGSSINVRHNPSLLPPPSPRTPSASNQLTAAPQNGSLALNTPNENDVRLRSKTLPPSKPPRTANDQPPSNKADEWETKLYGKYLEAGSSDSLKRRSWDNSKTILTVPKESDETQSNHSGEHIQVAITAPSTPNLEDQKKSNGSSMDELKPVPLPRCATLESINEKDTKDTKGGITKPEVVEKKEKSEKRIGKLKYFRKAKTDSLEDLRGAGKGSTQKHVNERIIIGHENERQTHRSNLEVSKELLKKFEGKSREEIMVIANDFENEVLLQKMKMKEMEDYLDDLLLRVMETHPKILQNPYRSQMSTKSG